jgi:hypothetical protein
MGKAHKRAKNKAAGGRANRKASKHLQQLKNLDEKCMEETRNSWAKTKMECIICEKKGKSTVFYACRGHHFDVRDQLKKHMMLKHPSVALKALGATLAGVDIIE